MAGIYDSSSVFDQPQNTGGAKPAPAVNYDSSDVFGVKDPQTVEQIIGVQPPEQTQSATVVAPYAQMPSAAQQTQRATMSRTTPVNPEMEGARTEFGSNVVPSQNPPLSPAAQYDTSGTADPLGGIKSNAQANVDQVNKELAPQVGQKELPVGNLPLKTRAWMGVYPDNDTKMAEFKSQFPMGEIKPLKYDDGTEELVFKLGPDQKEWARVKPTFFEKLDDLRKLFADSPESILNGRPELAKKYATDVLKDLGDNPVEIIAGVLGAAMSPLVGGVMATTSVSAVIGANVGAIPETLAQINKYKPFAPGDIAWEGGKEGLIWALANLAGFGGAGALNTITGAGTSIPPYIRRIDEAIRELNKTLPVDQQIPRLMPQQMSENQIMRRLTAQAAATNQKIPMYIENQVEKATQYIDGMASGKDYAHLKTELQQSIEDYKQALKKTVDNPNVTYRDAADIANKGIEDYATTGKKTVNGMYDAARKLARENGIGEPEYELTDALNFARKLDEGTLTQGNAVVDKFGTVQVPKVNIGFRLPGPGGVGVGDDSLASVVHDILAINPRLTPELRADGSIITPTEKLNDLRQRLYALTLPDPFGQVRGGPEASAAANKLYALLNKALDEPKAPVSMLNHNGGPLDDEIHPFAWRITNMFKDASDAAKEIFETTENAKLTQAMKAAGGDMATTPSSQMKTLLSPSSERMSEHIETYKKILQPEDFQKLKDAALTQLLEKPEEITTNLAKWNTVNNTKARNLLFDKDTLDRVKDIGKGFDILQSSGIGKAVEQQSDALALMKQLGQQGGTAYNDLLFKIMQTPSARESLRAAVLDDIFQRALVYKKGLDSLDGTLLVRAFRDYDDKKLLQVLTAEDKKNLKNVGDYLSIVQTGDSDVGAAMHGASAARDPLTHPFKLSTWETLWVNRRLGTYMTNPTIQAMIKGTGSPKAPRVDANDVAAGARLLTAIVHASSDTPSTGRQTNPKLNTYQNNYNVNKNLGFMDDTNRALGRQ